jgi:hypothetical protein
MQFLCSFPLGGWRQRDRRPQTWQHYASAAMATAARAGTRRCASCATPRSANPFAPKSKRNYGQRVLRPLLKAARLRAAALALRRLNDTARLTQAQADLNDVSYKYGLIISQIGINQSLVDLKLQAGAVTELQAYAQKADAARQVIPAAHLTGYGLRSYRQGERRSEIRTCRPTDEVGNRKTCCRRRCLGEEVHRHILQLVVGCDH